MSAGVAEAGCEGRGGEGCADVAHGARSHPPKPPPAPHCANRTTRPPHPALTKPHPALTKPHPALPRPAPQRPPQSSTVSTTGELKCPHNIFVDVVGRRADGSELAYRATLTHPTGGQSKLTSIGLAIVGERVAGLRGPVELPTGLHNFEELAPAWREDLIARARELTAEISVGPIDPAAAQRS